MTAIMTGPIRTATDTDEQFIAESDERLTQLRGRITAIKNAKVDAVADTRALTAVAIAGTDASPAQVVLHAPGGLVIQIGDVAHDQFAQRLKIDRRYYDRMNAEAAPLLADNLNWWLHQTPEERLLRMLKPVALTEMEQRAMAGAGAVLRLRGVLGKGYRTIDDADLVEALLPTLIEKGARLMDFSIDDRRMHAKFTTPPRDVATIRAAYAARYRLTVEQVSHHTRVNGVDVSWVNEVIATGVTIRHSEVGFASLGCSFFQRVMKCLNDYVADNAIAIRHVGGKNGTAEAEDVRYLSETTTVMENAALLSRVTDTVAHEFDDKAVLDRAHALLAAKTEQVDRPAALPLFEFVGNMGLNLGLTQSQTEMLKEETIKAIAEEGGEVKFAFVQGITAAARQMTDYDRRIELERSGFALLNDDAAALVKLGREAVKQRRTFAVAN